jgi:adenylate cyclase
MGKDIQLHHEILRAHLKRCGGYEVSTEGDSFKCVFHTPEEAVTYCTLVQLDLLTAPWSSELESGGEEAQRGKDDWADINHSQLDENMNSIMEEQITSSRTMRSRKSRSSTDLIDARAPLFSPIVTSAQSFSTKWLNSQVLTSPFRNYLTPFKEQTNIWHLSEST